jgi:hypothetical protein
MKKYILSAAILTGLVACNQPTDNEEPKPEETVEAVAAYEFYGDSTMTADDAVPSTELLAFMDGRDSVEAKVSGEVAEVCQKKGCWMSVEVDNGESMHVSYNYEFLLPKNCAGKEMVMTGYAYFDTIPVKHLKHLAEDAGKSEAEIAAITEPKPSLSFLATGVMIKKN